mmetsp:Transcript_27790/g.89401  ORF Transcript_27790/g.89401 Transcript_27790/m.89401 type:complete len:489 (-) Transcript_27790:244-1710(-)
MPEVSGARTSARLRRPRRGRALPQQGGPPAALLQAVRPAPENHGSLLLRSLLRLPGSLSNTSTAELLVRFGDARRASERTSNPESGTGSTMLQKRRSSTGPSSTQATLFRSRASSARISRRSTFSSILRRRSCPSSWRMLVKIGRPCNDGPWKHWRRGFATSPSRSQRMTKAKKLRMKFKYYADYVRTQQDDSPLYLFETNVDDNGYIRDLCKDYEVPDIFPHDWLALVNNDARPPFRWFCIGPKRSGTTVHTDPLGTGAWNAVTHGLKRWVLMEPGESKRKVKGRDLIKAGEDDEAIMYFDFILPRIKKEYPELKIYEGLQKPGEVIFVPGDWWHGVLNLEDTVAVTQNYCGPDNFDVVWCKARKEREKVAWLWLRNMKKFAPELYERAMEMNRRDKFRMRHERPKGERLPDASSSSSESSSDSSSDEAEDLDPAGLKAAASTDMPLGAAGFKRQGAAPLPELVTCARAGFERPGKRRRQKEDPDLA